VTAGESGIAHKGIAARNWLHVVLETLRCIDRTVSLVTPLLRQATALGSGFEGLATALRSPWGKRLLLGLLARSISGRRRPNSNPGTRRRREQPHGWWGTVGPPIGGTLAIMIIGLGRGLPDSDEREAAEEGALPISPINSLQERARFASGNQRSAVSLR
jgi:hypothetical protein